MKRQGMLVAAIAASMTIAVGAQQAQTGQDPAKQGTGTKSGQETITVTGCLSNAAGSGATASGTAGETGQTKGSEQQFMLTNATTAGASAKTGTGGTGTGAATAGTTGTGTSYRLIGGNRAELQKNLNSRVEIRGTLQPRGEAQSGGRATTGQEKSQQSTAQTNVQTLRVTAVKQISPNCESR